MKSTKKEAQQPIFPKMQIATNGNVFLMQSDNKGTCIHSPCGNFLGVHETLGYDTLTDFHGSITLEN